MILPLAALFVLGLILSRSTVGKRFFATVKPALTEKLASVGAVLAAFAILLHGNVWGALLLFGLALYLLGKASRLGGARTNMSRVRSAMIEMDYNQSSGAMVGRIIAGPHEGIELAILDQAQCDTIHVLCVRDDADGARLMEAYLHRRFPGWSPARQAHGHTGERRARPSSRMSEDEAYEVLGLRRGATRAEIVRSHRAVMKKWHPDQGGTTDLAALANEAKEVLLRRHA